MAGTICLRIFLMLLVSTVLLGTVVNAEDMGIKEKESGKPGPDLVMLESESDNVEIGDDIHLLGIIDRSLIGGSPSDAVILISAPDGSLADTFVLSTPDRHGSFDYALPADVGGNWGFEALYAGVYSPKVEIEVVPSSEPGKTTITLSGWPAYPKVGEDVLFKGRLTDSSGKAVPNREIAYEYAASATGCIAGCRSSDLATSEWSPAGFEQTDQSGAYSFTLPIVEEGGINIRARFEGDDRYTPSESRVLGISATVA